jgi:hypothetical protein
MSWTEILKKRGFDSLKQAYYLYKNKPDTFKHIMRKYGVPKGWHPYKRNRESGDTDIEAKNSREFIAAFEE